MKSKKNLPESSTTPTPNPELSVGMQQLEKFLDSFVPFPRPKQDPETGLYFDSEHNTFSLTEEDITVFERWFRGMTYRELFELTKDAPTQVEGNPDFSEGTPIPLTESEFLSLPDSIKKRIMIVVSPPAKEELPLTEIDKQIIEDFKKHRMGVNQPKSKPKRNARDLHKGSEIVTIPLIPIGPHSLEKPFFAQGFLYLGRFTYDKLQEEIEMLEQKGRKNYAIVQISEGDSMEESIYTLLLKPQRKVDVDIE